VRAHTGVGINVIAIVCRAIDSFKCIATIGNRAGRGWAIEGEISQRVASASAGSARNRYFLVVTAQRFHDISMAFPP
jgi:hypothetical protein